MTDSEVENLMALNMLIFYFVTSMFTADKQAMINEKLTSIVCCCCLAFCLPLVCFCFVTGLFLFCYFAGMFLFCCWPVTAPLFFMLLLC